ncbi:MAG: radical SAM protein [Dehalococcoidia bacterium]
MNHIQAALFDDNVLSLPTDYEPVRPEYMEVSRIYLAKGSVSTPERRQFVERICHLYPEATVNECLDIPHNRIELNETAALALHQAGKKTLVFGELKSAVRFSNEEGNTCPNYWHFSPYGFCPYGCKYCYLAGTQGVKFSPTVKIYVNLPEMLDEIDRIARRLGKPTSFYIGKLQDPLALDPLTAYSGILLPFFAEHPNARMTLLTKSANIDRLLELEHRKHTILSWSVNPPDICEIFEENVPGMDERLEAMRHAASSGYPVRAVMMPIIPVEGWQDIYTEFTSRLLKAVPIQRLTLGGICIYRGARKIMEQKIGLNNAISNNIEDMLSKTGDGRARYSKELRQKLYSSIIETARRLKPELELALCLEEHELWQNLRLEGNIGLCNCVL